MRRSEQIPYGVKDFKRIRLEDFYYVDKTAFIRKMEARANFLFFVRPRRFGKSLLCETLRCYYDVAEKDNFEKLFGDLDIGKNPTKNANRYFVLSLDFSRVGTHLGATWKDKFEAYLNVELAIFVNTHRALLESVTDVEALQKMTDASAKYKMLVSLAKLLGYGLYVLVDEYDNFTNEIVSTAGKEPYKEITHGTGFYRGWFKDFKATCDRIFMTGVSPVTMDDLTSGFNIATNISQEPDFHAMVGFTPDETRRLFEDFQGVGRFTGDVASHLDTVERWYDGYCFASELIGVESLFNCDMAIYYLSKLVALGKPPENLIDANIRSDWNKLNMILAAQRQAETFDDVLPLTEQLADEGEARINGYIRAYLSMNRSYMVRPEFAHPNGFSDYALFPDLNAGPATPRHSYVIELKHSKADASDAEIAKKHEEALGQLKKYSEDPNLAALAAGTPVHFLCYEFKGRELMRLEEVDTRCL